MIEFKQLVVHNYMSFKDETLPLANQGLTLVEGVNNSSNTYASNAAGKSASLSGITYALYGKTVEGVTSDEVINRQAGKDCHVFLDMELDGTPYRIERYRKDKKYHNKVRLLSGDQDLTQAKLADTNKVILDLLGIPFGTYVNTLAYGQGDEPVFSQATDKGKKEILENLANTAIYEQAKQIASQEKLNLDTKIAMINQQINSLQARYDQTQQYQDNAQAQYKASLAKVKSQQEQKESLEAQISPLEDDLSHAKQSLEEVQAHELKPAQVATMASGAYQQARDTYNRLNYQYKSEVATYKKLSQDYLDLDKQKICPTCGQVVTNEHKAMEKQTLTKRLQDQVALIKQIKADGTTAKQQMGEYQAKAEAERQLQQQVQAQELQYRDELNQAQNKVTSAQSKLDSAQQMLKVLANQVTVQKPQDYTKDLAKLQKELADNKATLITTQADADQYDQVAKKVFSRKGIQSMAMDLIIPFLNEHTNAYLAKLSGSILKVFMDAQTMNSNNSLSDKFDLKVENESGANSYQNCSAGERKRIDIAIAFAIQDLQNSKSNLATNLAIYDECFDGLDAVGAENVVAVLKEKQKTIPTIFVITHNENLKPLFDNTLTVTKGYDGISHMEGTKDLEN